MKTILINSNAPWSTSGYGQQTAIWAPYMVDAGYHVAISAFYGLEGGCLNWNGIHCFPTDNTRFGSLMLGDYAEQHGGGDRNNCLVFTLQDVWTMLPFVDGLKDLRFACWCPVDHDPLPPRVGEFLRQTGARVIAMSRHGQRALQDNGFDALYVPHGIDTTLFRPRPDQKAELRRQRGLPEDAFIVGMVACNQGIPSRKAYPEVLEAFAEFQRRHSDAIFYAHADITGRNAGVNLPQICDTLGIPSTATRTTDQGLFHAGTIPPHVVADTYQCFDVLLQPSLGEGFGIPAVEAQASGVPVILSDWTAMTEMCGAGWLVEGQRYWDQVQSSYWKIPFVSSILDALEEAYANAAGMGDAAVRFAAQYDVQRVWDEHFKDALEQVTSPREIEPLRMAA